MVNKYNNVHGKVAPGYLCITCKIGLSAKIARHVYHHIFIELDYYRVLH